MGKDESSIHLFLDVVAGADEVFVAVDVVDAGDGVRCGRFLDQQPPKSPNHS